MGKLSIEDCMCPICMCILVEPVTMPCSHTLCMPCFKQNVEETSLTCPMCRTRISVWARRAAKGGKLINQKLWRDIQSFFPDKIQKRIEGDDDEDDGEVFIHPIISIAEPGEIRKEYEEQLQRLEEQREKEQQKEREASEALIRKLQEEEELAARMRKREQTELQKLDEEFAKELINADGESPISIEALSRTRLTRSVSSCSSVSATSSRPPSTIETFLNKMREAEKLKEEDREATGISPYPYSCISPSDKLKVETDVKPKIETDVKASSGHSERCPSRISVSSSSTDSYSRTSKNNDFDLDQTVLYDYIDLESYSGAKAKSPANIKSKVNLNETSRNPSSGVENRTRPCSVTVLTDCGTDMKTAPRSTSAQSNDSISQELIHFKPIKLCPLTPPKRLASGKQVEPPLIRTTPRNLSKSGLSSPEPSLSDIDASSPIMQRRLSELSEERKELVQKFSKSTFTSTNNNSENDGRKKTSSFELVANKGNKMNVKDISTSQRGVENEVSSIDFSHRSGSASKISSAKKLIIPLEANLHDNMDDDFDLPPPLVEINNTHHSRSESYITDKPPILKKMVKNSHSDTIVKNRSGETKKKGSKAQQKDSRNHVISPQRSITHYLKGSNSCGDRSSSDIFKESVRASGSGRDEVDGNIQNNINLRVDKCGDSSKVKSISEKNDNTCSSKRRRKMNHDPDFVWSNLSPKKRERSKLACDSAISMYNSEGEDVMDTSSDISHVSSFSKEENDFMNKRGDAKIQVNKYCKDGGRKTKRLISEESTCISHANKRRKIDDNSIESTSNKRELKFSKSKQKTKKLQNHSKLKTKVNATRTMQDFMESLSGKSINNNSIDQEELDRQLALKLEKQFQMEARMSLTALRFKGGKDQYNFRSKPKYVKS